MVKYVEKLEGKTYMYLQGLWSTSWGAEFIYQFHHGQDLSKDV